LESMTIVSTTTVESGPWRHPFFTASSRRMYEPGFLAMRLPWLGFLLRRYDAGPLFVSIGMLPLENELSSRQISSLAWSVQRRHGAMRLDEVFDARAVALFPPETVTSDLLQREFFDRALTRVKIASLKEPYRREILEETRASIESDLARMEDAVRRGGSFYLTPEGRYSVDGRIGPLRGAIDRLAPLATIWAAGVSYDPFVSKRLSMLYRVARVADRSRIAQTLAALRPVVTSQLLSAWLDGRSEAFVEEDACVAVETAIESLPPSLFVDPELRAGPRRLVRAALRLMVGWEILEAAPSGYRLSAVRRHPQFPQVGDIVAYNARFIDETIANAAYSPR
jgi:hypothetical protein